MAANTKFSAFVIGGAGPFKFEIVSGPGQILRVENNRVDIQTASVEVEENIHLKVTDAQGRTGFAATLVFRRDEPYGSPNFKHSFYGPKVQMSHDVLLIGRADYTYFDFVRMTTLYGSKIDLWSASLHGGYVSILKKSLDNTWGLDQFLTARDACAELAISLNEKALYPYDFGEHYSFDGRQLAIRFGFVRGSPATSQGWSVLRLEKVTMIYDYDRQNSKLKISHTIFDHDTLGENSRNLNKPTHVSGDYLFNAVVQADRLNEHVRVFKKQGGHYVREATIEIPVGDANIQSINLYEDGLSIFSAAHIGGLTYQKNQNAKLWVYQYENNVWKLKQKFYPETLGSLLSVTRKNDLLVANSLLGESSQDGIKQYNQELIFYKKINGAWVFQSRVQYQDYSVCKEASIVSEKHIALGCAAPLLGHVPPASIAAATEKKIPLYQLTGTLIVFKKDQNDGWRVSEKINDPSEHDPNYAGFGWSLSSENGFISISHFFSDSVSVYNFNESP